MEAWAGIVRAEPIAARLLAAGLLRGAFLRRRQPTGRVDDTNRIAELQHQGLLRLLDSEERKITNDRGDREWHKKERECGAAHCCGSGLGGRFENSGSGRYGTTPCPAFWS